MIPALEAWRAAGRTIRVHGDDVFVRDEGPRDAPALLLLHGFPSSSFDFHLVLPALAARFRVVVHDHAGFGFSSKRPAESYSLVEQAEVALGLWSELGIERGFLIGHDYGTSVATEVLARRRRGGIPVEVLGVVLSNGSMLLELARRRLSQHVMKSLAGPLFARFASQRFFEAQIRAILRRPVDRAEIVAMWEALRHDEGHLLLPRLSLYNDERQRFRERWIGALRAIDVPVLFLWGEADPIARIAIPEQLCREVPGATLERLAHVGHYPMLEAPEEWREGVLRFARGGR